MKIKPYIELTLEEYTTLSKAQKIWQEIKEKLDDMYLLDDETEKIF